MIQEIYLKQQTTLQKFTCFKCVFNSDNGVYILLKIHKIFRSFFFCWQMKKSFWQNFPICSTNLFSQAKKKLTKKTNKQKCLTLIAK